MIVAELTKDPIACVGAGVIGSAWAALFAAHGFEVRVHDRAPAARNVLERVAAEASRTLEIDHRVIASKLHFSASLADSLDGVSFVQESVPESLELKQELFALIEQLSPPNAVIASSTSDFPISRIAVGRATSGRMLVGHPLNPPYAVPLVEVVPGPETSPETIEKACSIYRSAGRRPLVLGTETTGFLANRLQMALTREAIRLVVSGAATVAEVDRSLVDGLGQRLAAVGLFGGYVLNMPEPDVEAWLDHFAQFRFGEDLVGEGTFPLWSRVERSRVAGQWRDRIGSAGVEELRRRRDAIVRAVSSLQDRLNR